MKKFYCYSKRLAGFLLLKNQDLYTVKQDKDGKFLFIFWNEFNDCNSLLEEYKKIKGE